MVYNNNNRTRQQQDNDELPEVFQRLGSASRPPIYANGYKGNNYDPNYHHKINNSTNNNINRGMRIVRSNGFDKSDLYISTTAKLPDYDSISQMEATTLHYSPNEESDNYSRLNSSSSNSPIPSNKSNFNFVRTVEPKSIISFVKDPPFGQGGDGFGGFYNDAQQMIPNPPLPNYQQQQQQNWNNNKNEASDYHRTTTITAISNDKAKSIQITASLKDDKQHNGEARMEKTNDILITPTLSRKVTVSTPTIKRTRRTSESSRSRSPSPPRRKHTRRLSIVPRSRSPSARRKRRRSDSSPEPHYDRRRSDSFSEGNSRSNRSRRSVSTSSSRSPSPPHHRRHSITPRSTRRRRYDSSDDEYDDVSPFLQQRDDFYRPDYSQLDVGHKKNNKRIEKSSSSTVLTAKDAKSHSTVVSSTTNTKHKVTTAVSAGTKAKPATVTKATTTTATKATPAATKANTSSKTISAAGDAKKELRSHSPLGTLSNIANGATSFSSSQHKQKDLRSYPPLEVLDPSAAPRPYNKLNNASTTYVVKGINTSHNKVWVNDGNNTTPLPPSKKFSPSSAASSPVKLVGSTAAKPVDSTDNKTAEPLPSKKAYTTATAMNKAIATNKSGVTKHTGAAKPPPPPPPPPAKILGHKIIIAPTTILKNNMYDTPSTVAAKSSSIVNNPINDNHGVDQTVKTSVAKTTVKRGLSSVQPHGVNEGTTVTSHDNAAEKIGITSEQEAPRRKKARHRFTDVSSVATDTTQAAVNSASNSANANSASNPTSKSATSPTSMSVTNATTTQQSQQVISSKLPVATKETSAADLLTEQQKKIERLRQLTIEERDDIVMDIMSDKRTPPPNLGMRRPSDINHSCKKSSDSIVLKTEPMSDDTATVNEPSSSAANGSNGVSQPVSDLSFEQIVNSAIDTVFNNKQEQNPGKENNDTIMSDANDVNTTNKKENTVIQETNVPTISTKMEVTDGKSSSDPMMHYNAQKTSSKDTTSTLIPTPPNEIATAPAAPAAAVPTAPATTIKNTKKLTRLPRPWKTKMDDFGEIFYLNPISGEVRTERPTA